jgi:ribosomal protein S18 acetylase RimI-like enzyme
MGEANLFKQMRLTALQDSPHAFPATYEAAVQRSDDSWREQAERTARGTDRATFIAFSDDLPVGMAALYRREDQVDSGELLQVWVSPACRGTSLAADLMDVIFQWAGENGFRSIIAGVTKGNARAVRFYTRYGFSLMEETATGVYLVKEVQMRMAS